ncbi:unnamed protein product [Rhodiola kirilowii]
MSHIAVERNRRRQMNEHLKVLRSLTPSFYIKRGDQASIIGGVIDFIKELHQVLQVLDSKKRRKKSLSPSPNPSPRPLLQLGTPSSDNSPSPRLLESFKELGACCNSPVADVEAKLSGSNVVLRIVCKRAGGQVGKIVSVLERLCFDVLQLNISSMEDTVLYSFVVKIGLECELSVEELAQEIQKSLYRDDITTAGSSETLPLANYI